MPVGVWNTADEVASISGKEVLYGKSLPIGRKKGSLFQETE